MSKPVLIIAMASLAGMVAATANSGLLGLEANYAFHAVGRIFEYAPASTPRATVVREAPVSTAQGAFAYCLGQGGDSETRLRDILAFHEHEATLSLVECLLDATPQRFCPPEGGRKAVEAMEIYLWARDDARIVTPAHGLADKIRMLDRAASGGPPPGADPFAASWSSPRDKGLFEKLKALARQGYLEPNALALSGRAELREALAGVKPQASPCLGVAGAEPG